MQQTIDIRSIAEFSVIKVQAVLYAINIDCKIFAIRHVINNGTDFRKIDGHRDYFHDPSN